MSSPAPPAAVPASDPIVADDDASDTGSFVSSLTSLSPSIVQGVVGEGRRTYAAYGKEEYGFPMDEQELERMDIAHTKYFALLEKHHFFAPIGDNPQRILDLGCGTGIWSIDVADKYPGAQVVGVDIAPTQLEWVPPNCSFELDDIEQPWTWKENSADFIFSRDLITAIRDFPKLIDQCYKHLKPGGWIEYHCITGVLGCDDGTIPKDSTFQKFSDCLRDSCIAFGTPVDDPTRWKQQFTDRGFESVTEKIYKLPTAPWAKDQRLKLIGAWEQHNLLTNLEGLVMRIFNKGLGWTEEQTAVFLAHLRQDIRSNKMHGWWPYYIVYGQKPLSG
ncbi:23S rRNA U2552 (ribose-2'-O)-methylase RlmE/FtsJ [Geosmithia morbida]|uniref:23S rRNA U2552 (Ribose-2'-O)-methylase RlmE/FtsJ n=1 Tax=Geosmithia morbida TaxID=1094350 RepID=A0A9P4Z193_9HYPO|nr:23S rRNA U2552 (ribose-2'-O)-methylase RlmE/FtsJ [Geosmithia morbida]KAF4125428.1 23S rRNA U2552 (ribose-2'-O)-methylase RlmE/FtsJ [Geosmithia morbida]